MRFSTIISSLALATLGPATAIPYYANTAHHKKISDFKREWFWNGNGNMYLALARLCSLQHDKRDRFRKKGVLLL